MYKWKLSTLQTTIMTHRPVLECFMSYTDERKSERERERYRIISIKYVRRFVVSHCDFPLPNAKGEANVFRKKKLRSTFDLAIETHIRMENGAKEKMARSATWTPTQNPVSDYYAVGKQQKQDHWKA